jgi:hypothetical protein
VDLSRAQLSNLGDSVSLVDPDFPWEVIVRLDSEADRPEVLELFVVADPDNPKPITSTALAQIPVRQIASVAASALRGEGEAQYRMLAQPRPAGVRSWPTDHFQRVARVASWARRTGRPGGAAGAVSEFWDVHYRTARRWIARLPRDADRPER